MTQASETEAAEALVGTVLGGRYRIEQLIGLGGMGAVYRAEHVMMRKTCAVKVLHREMTQMKEVVARFEREAVAAARIDHPHVATATDFGQLEDGSFYLVLEFIEGKSLARTLYEGGPFTEERALLMARQIVEALSAAHAAGIVHRDLKPDNVMLVGKGGGDFVKVLDFGIAKVQIEGANTTEQALTRINTVMGTPEYMAPEQARGEAVDHRADIYTLGVILYEMLSGTSPYRHEEFVVVLTKKLTEDPPPLPDHVSAGTRALVGKLIQRSAADRPQTAAEVLSLIDAALGYSPAPSLAFAPVSGQGAVLKKAPSQPDVPHPAYAATVIGDVAAQPPPAPSLASRLKSALPIALARGVELAKRPIALGARNVPLGAIGGALFGFPVVLALAISAATGGSAASAKDGPAAPVHIDRDLAGLMKQAERGEAKSLTELAERAVAAKVAPAYRALGRGYFKVGQADAALRAYRAGGDIDPKLGEDPDVMADLKRALVTPSNEALVLETASHLGPGGADFLYDLYDTGRTANPALSKQAKALLDSDAVAAHRSPALEIALDLPKAKAESCTAVKNLLPRVEQNGDARVMPTLNRLNDRRGCGFLGLRDCFACLRTEKGKDLAAALKAASARPAPKFGG